MLSCAVALILLIDVSASVSDTDYTLQKNGVVSAFNDIQIQKIIESHSDGIAISIHEWSTNTDITIPWIIIKTKDDLSMLIELINKKQYNQNVSGMTGLGRAIDYAIDYFVKVPCQPDRKIIDVSSDGKSNIGIEPLIVRDRAIQELVTINGLPILNETEKDLVDYYQTNIITPDGFLISANGYMDFIRAIKRKLLLEIANLRDHIPLLKVH